MKKVFLRNKLISLLLCICMLISILPVQAYATDGANEYDSEHEQVITDGNATPPEKADDHTTECDHVHDEACGGLTHGDNCTYACEKCAAAIQALVDALPAMDSITEENRDAVSQQLSAIHARYYTTSDATRAIVKWQRFEDAAFVLSAPEGFFGFMMTKRYEAGAMDTPTASFAFLDGSGTAATVITAEGVSTTSVSPVPNGVAFRGYLPAGTYTVEESVDGEWDMTLTVNGAENPDAAFTGAAGGCYSLMAVNSPSYTKYDISSEGYYYQESGGFIGGFNNLMSNLMTPDYHTSGEEITVIGERSLDSNLNLDPATALTINWQARLSGKGGLTLSGTSSDGGNSAVTFSGSVRIKNDDGVALTAGDGIDLSVADNTHLILDGTANSQIHLMVPGGYRWRTASDAAFEKGSQGTVQVDSSYFELITEGHITAEASSAEEHTLTCPCNPDDVIAKEAHSGMEDNVCDVCGFTVYNIWVDGLRVNDENQDDILGGGELSYDPDTKTLTVLKDVTIDQAYYDTSYYTGGILAKKELIITGSGTTLTVAVDEDGHDGINASGLTITGNVTVNVTSRSHVINVGYDDLSISDGAYVTARQMASRKTIVESAGNVSVENSALIVEGTGFAVYCSGSSVGSLSLKNAVVDLTSSSPTACGLYGFTVECDSNSHLVVRTQNSVAYDSEFSFDAGYWRRNSGNSFSYGTVPGIGSDKYFEFVGEDHLSFDEATATLNCGHGLSIPVEASVTVISETEYYSDLASAVTAATENGTDILPATLTLLRDAELTETLNIDKGVCVLDLNGRAIRGDVTNAMIRQSGGKLILTDNSANKTGSITNTRGWAIQAEAGELTLKGGSVTGADYGILVTDTAELTVDGGTVSGTNTNNGTGIGVNGGGTATVNGGTITGATYALHTLDGSTATVNGGTLEGLYALYTAGDVTLNGGTLEGSRADIAVAEPFTVGDLDDANYTLAISQAAYQLPFHIATAFQGTPDPNWFTYVTPTGTADSDYLFVEGDRQVNGAALIEGGKANELYLYHCEHDYGDATDRRRKGVCSQCGTQFAAILRCAFPGTQESAFTCGYTSVDAALAELDRVLGANANTAAYLYVYQDYTGDIAIDNGSNQVYVYFSNHTLHGQLSFTGQSEVYDIKINNPDGYGVKMLREKRLSIDGNVTIESSPNAADIWLAQESLIHSIYTAGPFTVAVEDTPGIGESRIVAMSDYVDIGKLDSANPSLTLVAEYPFIKLTHRLKSVTPLLGSAAVNFDADTGVYSAVFNHNSASLEVLDHQGNTLEEDADYTVTWKQGDTTLSSAPVAVGTYTYTVTGIDDYAGITHTGTLAIVKNSVKDIYWNGYAVEKTYDGAPLAEPDVDFRMEDGSTLSPDRILWRPADTDEWQSGTLPVDAGKYWIRAELDETGTVTGAYSDKQVTIHPAAITDVSVADPTYSGEELRPSMLVTCAGGNLTSDDYEVTFYAGSDTTGEPIAAPRDAGVYTAAVTGKGNYTGTLTAPFEITPAVPRISVSDVETEWTGTEPDLRDKVSVELVASETYDPAVHGAIVFSYADEAGNKHDGLPADAGGYTITATLPAMGNYEKGETTFALTITPKTVTNPTIELSFTSAVYTGKEIRPTVIVKDGDTVVLAGEYTVKYSDNINRGTATVQITDKDGGNYVVSGSTTFTIEPKPLTHKDITAFLTPDQVTYDGTPKIPTVTVKDGDKILIEDTDYVVTMPIDMTVYQEAPRSIDVVGMGNYKDSISLQFYMDKATPAADGFVFTPPANLTYDGQPKEAAVEAAAGINGIGYPNIKYFLNGEEVAEARDAGTYTVKVDVYEGPNYNETTDVTDESWTFTIAPKPVTPSIMLSFDSLTYNSKEQEPRVMLMDGSTEIPAKEYIVKYFNNVNVGVATVEIYDIDGGNYTVGSSSTTFAITPAKLTITADDKSVPIGSKTPALTYTVTGLLGSDKLVTAPTVSYEKTSNMNYAGTTNILVSGADAGSNYTITYVTGKLNVYVPATQVRVDMSGVTVDDKAYDGIALSITGAAKGDYPVQFTYTWYDQWGNRVSAPIDAGTYVLRATVNSYGYTGYGSTTVTIEKAQITITADDLTAELNGELPELTYIVTGLADGDALKARPVITCEADMTTVGEYPILVGGAVAPDTKNYEVDIVYHPGTLTVTDPAAEQESESTDPPTEDATEPVVPAVGDGIGEGDDANSDSGTGSDDGVGENSGWRFPWWILLLIAAAVAAYIYYRKRKKE